MSNYQISQEERQELTEKIKENDIGDSIFVIIGISYFIAIYLITMLDVLTLSIFGLLTCFFAKIRMNYKAIFNMSIYALTLSIILRIIYVLITMLTEFKIKYFNVMYISISYIILAAAIFMIKSDILKQQLQLINIIEQSKEKIEETIKIPKRPKENDDKNEEKKDDKEEPKDTEEEQGSNA